MITHAYLGGLLPSFLAAGGAFTCDLVAARQIRDSLGGWRRGEGPPLICINICGPKRCVTLRQYPITMRTAKWVDNCAQTNGGTARQICIVKQQGGREREGTTVRANEGSLLSEAFYCLQIRQVGWQLGVPRQLPRQLASISRGYCNWEAEPLSRPIPPTLT